MRKLDETAQGLAVDKLPECHCVVQMKRFYAAVEQEVLYLLLEASGVGYVWRRLQARHSKEVSPAAAGRIDRGSSMSLSFAYLLEMSSSAVLEICKGDASQQHEVLAVMRSISHMSNEERYKAVGIDSSAVQEQVWFSSPPHARCISLVDHGRCKCM